MYKKTKKHPITKTAHKTQSARGVLVCITQLHSQLELNEHGYGVHFNSENLLLTHKEGLNQKHCN